MKIITPWRHAVELTGTAVHPDTWMDTRAKRALLTSQTVAIAAKLTEGGVEPRRAINGTLTIVGACSGESQTLETWRHINFLPIVAADNRSQVLRRAQYLAESKPFFRYAVMTNGARCGVRDLRSRLQSLAREISQWAKRGELAAWGIRVQLRASEITVKFDGDGWSYHPHANVVYECSRRLLPDEWEAFLHFTRSQMSGHWQECGRLVDPKEAIKYPLKPADLECLSPEELARLSVSMHGLKLVQPMADLAALGKDLADRRLKLAKRIEGGAWRWCFVKMHAAKAAKDGDAGGTSADNLLAVLAPQPRFMPRMEPCLLVANYGGNVGKVIHASELSEPMAPILAAWRAAIESTPSPQLAKPARQSVGVKWRRRPQAAVVAESGP